MKKPTTSKPTSKPTTAKPTSKTSDEGWLVDASQRRPTPNRFTETYLKKRVEPLELIVLHASPGPYENIVRWLTSRDSSQSAHFVVSRNGQVTQLAPITERTWHLQNGAVTWRRTRAVTHVSISVELENFGRLKSRKRPDRSIEITTLRGDLYTGAVWTAPDGGLWEPFSRAQLDATYDVVRRIIDKVPTLAARLPVELPPEGTLVGHEHIDKTRSDPGPAFPWAELITKAHR